MTAPPVFLVDEQLPRLLAERIRRAGYGAEHVRDIGRGGQEDVQIWQYASVRQLAVLSKDADFADMARTKRGASPQIVWLRFGNISNDALWRRLSPLLPEIARRLRAGERLIEITRS